MNPVQRPDSFEAADYVGVLRRRWWIALALTCVGLVAASGYVTVAPKVYSATASVSVVPTAADQSNAVAGSRTAGATVNLDTQAQVVTSTGVATLAGKMMTSPLTPWQLAKQVSVTVPPNSSILDITCKASTPAGSATCANDFAKAYLQDRQQSAVTFVNQQLKTLQQQVSTLNTSIAALSTKIGSEPTNSPQRANNVAQLGSDKSKLSKLTQDYATTNGELADTNGGAVITIAAAPGKPSSPKKLLIVPSGLVAGLLIGLILALLVDRRDKRIHNALHAERVLDLPVLLNLPSGSFGREVAIASPRSKTGQAFTDLAHGVAAALGEGNHVVFVAGATQGPAGMPGLWVITPGADPSLAFYHLQHDTARALTSQLRRDARYVIIEAQSADDGADTFALGEFADAALVTIEVVRSTKTEATECVRRLRQLRTPVLGAAILPALGKRIAVRPPRQGQPRPGSGPDTKRDSAPPGRGHSDFSPISGASANMSDRRDRPARVRDGHGGR